MSHSHEGDVTKTVKKNWVALAFFLVCFIGGVALVVMTWNVQKHSKTTDVKIKTQEASK